jgi:dTMP kinase
MRDGIFITFEGSEACGKSTQFERLKARLEAAGASASAGADRRRLVTVREPGGTPVGEEIRRLLKFAAPGWSILPEAELLLFAASRAQLAREVIAPALSGGALVLCDRFFDSTTVYQGVARRLAAADVDFINRFAAGGLRPDLTFLLDLSPDAAFERLRRRDRALPDAPPPDRMEQEPREFYEQVRAGYLRLAASELGRIVVIDAAPSAEEVERTIWNHFTERFHGV